MSALIHAATMVTAGVYLLMRSSPLIEYSNTVLLLCLWIGAITTVFSSLIGLFQQDIKKVIAYSTMSQLARIYNRCVNFHKLLPIIYKNQTICVEVLLNKINLSNSQITKSHGYVNYNHISNSFFNSFINTFWLCTIIIYYLRLKLNHLGINYKDSYIEKWKTVIISKLVGISEAIRLILIYFSPYFLIFTHWYRSTLIASLLLSFKRKYTVSNSMNENKDKSFNQWLAGVIDGDGHFSLSKKGIARLYIVMDIRDKKALYEILHKFGGSIRPIAKANALRYNLSNKKGLIKLINAVNGEIRNPSRLLQLDKFCTKYKIKLIYPNALTYNNGWLSGFIDSDGSVYFSESSGQVFISATQKNIYLLQPLINLYGGRVDPSNSRGQAFKYVIYRKKELFNLRDNYFEKYPLKTLKSNRIKLIKEFYDVKLEKKNNHASNLKAWVEFKDKWDKYM